METNEVTKRRREEQNLSVRGFSDAINSRLINTGMSASMVSRLENDHYEPPLNLLFECIATYHSTDLRWIAEWAIENIKAMYPDLVDSGIIAFHLPKAQ